ncbi:MAG: hypothetical protein ACLT1W_03365 [Alistipes onderdonkii]
MRRTKTMLMGDLLEEFFKRPCCGESRRRETARHLARDRGRPRRGDYDRAENRNHILYARIQSSVLRSSSSTSARRSRRRSTAARACGWSMP